MVSGVRAEEELVGLAAGFPLIVEVVSTHGSSRARRRATSVISCFITSSGKKWAIQFTNATHKSFVVNSPVTRRLRWESASARVSVVSHSSIEKRPCKWNLGKQGSESLSATLAR